MKNQNHEIVTQSTNEIEPLNEILGLDLESLEAITGGGCGTRYGSCPSLICGTNSGKKLTFAQNESSDEFVAFSSDSFASRS